MNRGSPNKENTETLLDRLNKRLARLMGKKDQTDSKISVPGNLKFTAIVVSMMVFLWLLTGIYYIPDQNYGLILQNGTPKAVVNGMKVGFTLPYPFSDVINLDSSSNTVAVGKAGAPVYMLSQDDQQLAVIAGISYYIADPEKFYLNYYQDEDNLDQKVGWLSMAIIQDYVLHHQSQYLLKNSTIVTSNEIRALSDKVLLNYGLKFGKFSIDSIKAVTVTPILSTTQASPADKLLAEARAYSNDKESATQTIINEFNQLLPQYKANKQAIVELMYYKMLSGISSESHTMPNYPLLGLTLAQIKEGANSSGESFAVNANQVNQNDIRALNRSVDRQRTFKDR